MTDPADRQGLEPLTKVGGKGDYSPPPISDDAFDDPASDHLLLYGTGLRSFPVSPDIAPPVTAEQAMLVVEATGWFSERRGPRRATLRMVSVGWSEDDPGFAVHLGWVLTQRAPGRWRGSSKRRQREDSGPPPGPVVDYVYVSVVNATTGDIDGHHHQFCRLLSGELPHAEP